MKTVNFLGQDWSVTEWAEWITQDSDGHVFVWEDEPKLMRSQPNCYMTVQGRFECVGDLPFVSPKQKI